MIVVKVIPWFVQRSHSFLIEDVRIANSVNERLAGWCSFGSRHDWLYNGIFGSHSFLYPKLILFFLQRQHVCSMVWMMDDLEGKMDHH